MIVARAIQIAILLGYTFWGTRAVIPLAELTTRKVLGSTTIIYGAPGSFSGSLSEEKDAVFMRLVKPTSGFDGCDPVAPVLKGLQTFYLLVGRGNCTFLDKAIAAYNIGASGIVVFNSLEGIYQGNEVASGEDYECDNGSGYVDTVISPVYSDEMTDLMPTSCTSDSKCSSGRCVFTNTTRSDLGSQVCCAWDLYTTMATSAADEDDSVFYPKIPSIFVRMEDSRTLEAFDELESLTLEVALFQRPSSIFDFASILVWFIAVMTVTAGASMAAEEDKQHQQGGDFKARRDRRGRRDDSLLDSNEGSVDPRDTSRDRGCMEDEEDFSRDDSSLVKTGLSKGPGQLIGSEGSSAAVEAEAEAGPSLSLGTGVIEDMSSFSPFSSLFTSASIAHEEKASSQTHSQSNTSSGGRTLEGRSGNSSSSSNSSRRGLRLDRLPSVESGGSSSSSREDRYWGRDRERNRDRDRRRDSYGGFETDRLKGKGRTAASKSYSPQGLNDNDDVETDALQITPHHALGFILLSSSFLLIMYFIDIYFFVSLLYLLSAAFASSKVFFHPFFIRLQRTYTAIRLNVEIEEVPDPTKEDDVCGATVPMICSGCLSTGLCVLWFIYREDLNWIWLVQDFLGVSVCMLFLSSVHLPNLRAATILLGLAFCYDVFFVFISPYVFGSSVMVTVATGSSGTIHTDENYCEKYPTDSDCDLNSLPMLLVVPTFSGYLSSESLLGLGDIVLPGLLLVWAARLDIRRYGSLSSHYASRGHFPMVVFGYAIGLMVANFAVSYFETGQPALLYIVPLTLGPVLLRSFRAESLPELWKALPRMKTIAQPFDRAEQEALLAGRASLLLAEATWGEKAADVAIDYLDYSQSAESVSVSCEPYDSAAVAVPAKSIRAPPSSALFADMNSRYHRRRDDDLI